MKTGVAIAALVAIGVAIVLGYRWWTSDERAIRKQLATIAAALTIGPNQGDLAPVTRIAALRKVLAPDIQVAAGSSAGARTPAAVHDLVGRDTVLAVVSQWIPPPGGIRVEFVDVQVTVADDRRTAEVYCTAKVESRASPTAPPTVDAKELTVGFAKEDGAWLVTAVRTEDTLAR